MNDRPEGLTLDHRMLAALAREVEEGDPIAWTDLDRDTVYDLIASQIAEMFAGYERRGVSRDRQMVIALATVVKLTVENFVLHQRLMRGRREGTDGPRGAARSRSGALGRAPLRQPLHASRRPGRRATRHPPSARSHAGPHRCGS